MKNLEEINQFGAVDADMDDILLECFEDHAAYREICDFSKFLVIGRKGSGKTAIYRKLLKRQDHDTFAFGHNFTDYPWHLHQRLAVNSMPEHEKYIHSWKYLIYISLSKILLNFDNSQPYSDDAQVNLEKVERFVIDSYGTKDPDVVQIFGKSKKLRIHPTFKIECGPLKAGISLEKFPMDELPTVFQEVNKNLQKCLINGMNPDNKYFVCFDQLDLNFDPKDNEYSSRLIGLLLAARDIFTEAKQNNKKLSIVVFLRDDIYSHLQFEDKNKLTQNFMTEIKWDERDNSPTLKKLMENRFNKLLSDENAIIWDDVFDESKDMSGHQSKYQHILDRTFLRPRDIILFCNMVLKSFKNNKKIDATRIVNRFENIDINTARNDYSNYLLNELDDELHKHIVDYKIYLEIFKSIGYLQFNTSDFLTAYEKRKNLLPNQIQPIDILKILFEFSIVGYYKVGGSGYGGSEWIYRYKDPRSQFDESSTIYRVHLGLMEALGLKRYSKTTQ
ncbi:MAG: hypothetical protein CVT49_02865 [candidate division Zixibacteria bacterium HGW-Zixibacteria-1]|nr:MAG: hypothetical protein CVT49_02865 [candidate division Zixibacteria bacterium HGW-Zixibacteria-1]